MSISTAARSSHRPRWAIAAVAATVALAASIGGVLGAFLITDRAAADVGVAAGYVPADAVAYVEARLDLPGDQRAALTELLGRFSGIEIDDVLGAGLADKLDALLDDSGVDSSYRTDIAPWFDGRLALAVLDAGDVSAGAMNPLAPMAPGAMTVMPDALIVLGTRDAAATTAFLDRVRGDAEADGATSTSETYAGTTIWSISVSEPQGIENAPEGAGGQGAYALSDDQLILSASAEAIHTALDVHAGSAVSFGARDDVRSALAELPEDRVATFVSDATPMVEMIREQLTSFMPELDAIVDVYASGISMLQVGSLRFEGDRIVADGAGSMPSRGMANSNRTIAEAVPADALVYLDGTDIGAYLADLVTAAKEAAVAAGQAAAVAQVEGILGADVEAFVAWVDDAAVVAGWDGSAPWGGLLITPTSTDEAELRLGQLRALAGMAGMAGSEIPLTVTEDVVNGVDVTRFTVDGMGTEVAFEYAITDGRMLLGFGDSFVERVLATDAGSSLATNDRFMSAIDGAGGASSTSIVWADISAIRAALEEGLPADEHAKYSEHLAAWLEPLDTLIGVMRVDGDLVISRGALIAK